MQSPPIAPEESARAAAKRKLTDRALDVEFDAGHFRKQIDIGASDRAAAKGTKQILQSSVERYLQRSVAPMTGREVKNGRSAQAARAFAKPNHEPIMDA